MSRLSPFLVAVGLLLATPVFADDLVFVDDNGAGEQEPVDRAREAAEMLLRQLQDFLGSIPLYGAPYIDDEGNIVIPKVPQEGPDEDEQKGEPPVVEET